MIMNNIKSKLAAVLLVGVLISSCKKENGPLSDIKPGVPVTVTNAVAFRPEPTVTASKSAIISPGVIGPITIILSIPASSGRKITSITKVAASTTYSAIQSTGTTGFYTTAPVMGSGTTATFTTNLTEYVAKTGQAITASNTELTRRFYFLITLDDNTIIIPEPVRVLVID